MGDVNYTPLILTIVAALIAGVPPTLAAIAAYKQSMAALIAAQKNTEVSEKISTKTEVLVGKVEEVHTVVNSNLAGVKAELAAAVARIENLIATVSELKTERGKAQVREALYTNVPERRADSPAAIQQLAVQEEIAKNTGDTAEHTAALIKNIEEK